MRSRFNAQDLLPELGEISAALFKVTGNGSVPLVTVGLIGLAPAETWTWNLRCSSSGPRDLVEPCERVGREREAESREVVVQMGHGTRADDDGGDPGLAGHPCEGDVGR